MTDKTMLEAPGEVSACTDSIKNGWLRESTSKALQFLKNHHDEICHNALRLRALEQAMGGAPHDMKLVVNYLSARADEIMRESEVVG